MNKPKIGILFLSTILAITITSEAFGQWTQTSLNAQEVNCFAVIGTNLYAGTPNGVYLTTNNGISWTMTSSGLPKASIFALAVKGTNLFAALNTGNGNGGGVYLSTDNGTTWTGVNAGIGSDSAYIACFAVSGKNLFAGGYGVYLSTNNGTSWTAAPAGLPSAAVDALAVSDSVTIAGMAEYGVYHYSTNNDTSWIVDSASPIGADAFVVSGANIFAGGYNYNGDGGVFLSTDNGMNWSLIGLSDTSVTSIAISGVNIFAGIYYDNNGYYGGGVFLSTNNGSSWHSANTGFNEDPAILALKVVGTNLFAGTANHGAWRIPLSDFGIAPPTVVLSKDTLDFGTHIYGSDSTLNIELHNTSTTPIGIDTEEITSLGAAAEDFAIISNTMQATLPYELQLGDSIGFTITYTAPANTENDTATFQLPFAETPGTAIQVTLIGSSKHLAGVAETTSSPLEIQIYPNPLTQSTTISFTWPESGVAEVTIVNLLGEEVARVFSGALQSGEHSFSWDASGMPPGIYECLVRMNGNVERVGMVLAR